MAYSVIFGLGNPGRDYSETRHNAGFLVLDRLAQRLGHSADQFQKERKFDALVLRAGPFHLVKPQTYMNLSGQSVGKFCRFHQIPPEAMLVIFDDLDLPLGKLRFRARGSAGGHNGVKSILQHLGADEFPRLKVGIGRRAEDRGQDEVIGHVLGRFSAEEKEIAIATFDRAAEAALFAHEHGLEAAMGKFNG